MKRRVRIQPTNPYYTKEPAVATGLIADKPMVPNATLADNSPKMVPKKPGKSSGFAGGAPGHKPRQKGFQAPKVGAPAKPATNVKVPSQGKLRMSGHPKAHRIGGIKKLGKI